ncbi:MAG: Flp pilus assembly complex ATPase component TadA [Candidatus Eremiobacteraeota bacterium]|nr:Flp pilus assembly complex ATPase component TadA [Candidatus Eremiobacteraeota bacterium]
MDFLQQNLLLPLEENGTLRIAVCHDTPAPALEDARLYLKRDFDVLLLPRDEIEQGLRNLMAEDMSAASEDEDMEHLVLTEDETQDLFTLSRDAPIIRLVNTLFLRAVNNRASDIHIEPYEKECVVRFRVDGVLHEILNLTRSQYSSAVARVKVMSKLNLAEHRLPQDGRMRIKAGERVLDVRVSVLPTLFGERVVLRLLDRECRLLTLKSLGLLPDDYEMVKDLVSHPYGSILSTGPTGSGKSTTLYAILLEVKSPNRNIITIEDPVEYQVPGIGQIPVNPKIGITFATGLRSILRQDPDVIMVGEIRDPETADIATHAALTGHLVLSTLHTNDAPTAVARMVDMEVESYLLSSSLLGIIAQRLVRRLCPYCKEQYDITEREMKQLNMSEDLARQGTFFRPTGCDKCLGTGYHGRMGLFEILKVDEEMRGQIIRSPESNQIRKLAVQHGMRTLLMDGAIKVAHGLTSVEEVLNATRL